MSINVFHPVVSWFSLRMENKLCRNDHKDGWTGCSIDYLLNRLFQECIELDRAVKEKDSAEDIINECADVANFAMMIANKQRDKSA